MCYKGVLYGLYGAKLAPYQCHALFVAAHQAAYSHLVLFLPQQVEMFMGNDILAKSVAKTGQMSTEALV